MLACALASAIASPALAAGETATLQGNATAEVLQPGAIVKVRDMYFAYIAAAATPGTVVLNPDTSICTPSGALVLSGTCQAAVFDGLAPGNQRVRIRVSNSISLAGSNGGSMLLDNFTLDTDPELQFQGGNGNGIGNGNRRYSPTSPTGDFSFRVGGRLNVGANQIPGTYLGTFDVSVHFQ